VVLACTELPLSLNEANCGMPVIDTTALLARAAVARAVQGTEGAAGGGA
jgi:aspartate racemase